MERVIRLIGFPEYRFPTGQKAEKAKNFADYLLHDLYGIDESPYKLDGNTVKVKDAYMGRALTTLDESLDALNSGNPEKYIEEILEGER